MSNNFLNLFIKGIFLGIANIIPGVSGGTIAVVLRIFDQLIDAVNNFLKNPKKHILFLTPLILGAGSGILLFSKVLELALEKQSMPTSMFFVGLVVGSIPLIYGQAKKKEVNMTCYLAMLMSFVIVSTMAILSEPSTTSISEIVITPIFLLQIFISCIIASSAMIIPGISGSFVMILLGIYNIILVSISGLVDTLVSGLEMAIAGEFIEGVLSIIKSNSFLIILVGGIGIVIGVILVSRLIDILLERAFSLTYFTILGLIIGSVFSIFIDPMTYSSYSEIGGVSVGIIAISIAMGLLGFVIAYKLSEE